MNLLNAAESVSQLNWAGGLWTGLARGEAVQC